MSSERSFKFNISLSVLNHLGRNLYRSFITVLGEAISNAWDADATEVRIDIDREKKWFKITDNGSGMNADDFQNKYLLIGYQKREEFTSTPIYNRAIIGRKGIGKLALLSVAERVTILSQKNNEIAVGGTIDNGKLDHAIESNTQASNYLLEPIDDDTMHVFSSHITHGTQIIFDNIYPKIVNRLEYLRESVALYFKFSMIDPNFKIFFNGEEITEADLKRLADNTQFLWKTSNLQDSFVDSLSIEERFSSSINVDLPEFKGFIASVKKPANLNYFSNSEKLSIDLFVNGRLREKDILKHIPTARIVESYLYGQLHYNELDKISENNEDRFTSSREGIVDGDAMFIKFLKEIKPVIKIIIDEWDEFREKINEDGDSDNTRIKKKERKAKELYNVTVKDYTTVDTGDVADWITDLSEEAKFNIPAYTDCFIAENLLRKFIDNKTILVDERQKDEADKWIKKEGNNLNKAKLSIPIRQNSQDIMYLDMGYLSAMVDKFMNVDPTKGPTLVDHSVRYKPVRDAMAHTSLLTIEAKKSLSATFDNIKAEIIKHLKNKP